jgi:hypothetical protein
MKRVSDGFPIESAGVELHDPVAVEDIEASSPSRGHADHRSVKQLEAWLRRYLDLAIQHANLSHDSSRMFHAVPAYVDGLEALQRVKYAAGMPIGPAPMVIRTYVPYNSFWTRALMEVDDFRERSRPVSVGLARPDAEITWISGIPYASKPTPD